MKNIKKIIAFMGCLLLVQLGYSANVTQTNTYNFINKVTSAYTPTGGTDVVNYSCMIGRIGRNFLDPYEIPVVNGTATVYNTSGKTLTLTQTAATTICLGTFTNNQFLCFQIKITGNFSTTWCTNGFSTAALTGWDSTKTNFVVWSGVYPYRLYGRNWIQP